MAYFGYGRHREPLKGDIFRTEKPEGKKIKEVYDNEGLTHAWASGNVPRGRSGYMFFERGVIYSFGHHYEAAKIYTNERGEKLVLINEDGYSTRTKGHLALIRSAVTHLKSIEVPHVDVIVDHASNVEYLEKKIFDRIEGIFSMTGWHGDGNSVRSDIERYNDYLNFFKLKGEIKLTEDVEYALEVFTEMYQAKEKKSEARRKKREETERVKFLGAQMNLDIQYNAKVREFLAGKLSFDDLRKAEMTSVCNGYAFGRVRRKYLYAVMAKELEEAYETKVAEINADTTAAWKRGELRSFPWNARPKYALLRVNGNKVETSQGADVPLTHALRLLGLIERKQVRKGERVGHYTLDSVDSLGDVPPVVTIGCHKILLSEAQAVLGPYRNGEIKIVETVETDDDINF